MHGKNTDEVKERREQIINEIAKAIEKRHNLTYKVDFEINVVNPLERFKHPLKAGRLWYLGKAISDMDLADVVIFDKNASNLASGCKMEYLTAVEYKKPCYSVTSPVLGEVGKFMKNSFIK
jgi:hypothetical protein